MRGISVCLNDSDFDEAILVGKNFWGFYRGGTSRNSGGEETVNGVYFESDICTNGQSC